MKESEFLQPLQPPVPPPLPSVCMLDSEKKISPLTSSQGQSDTVEENELEAAVQNLLSSEKNLKDVFCLKNSFLQPQLQAGPKCGLVALSIATSIIKKPVNVKDIFELALAHGFTKQGEIFDANALAILAQKLGFNSKVLDGGLMPHLHLILKTLFNKCLLLVPVVQMSSIRLSATNPTREVFDQGCRQLTAQKVIFRPAEVVRLSFSHAHCPAYHQPLLYRTLSLTPFLIKLLLPLLKSSYDADFNHFPCCKKGSRAHWAIISGVIVMEEKSENEKDSDEIVINSSQYGTPAGHQLYISYSGEEILITDKSKNNGKTLKNGKVYLIGLQGKSKHIGLWSFEDMALSNNNLIYFPPSRNPDLYVVPEGGIEKGLKGRAVLLEHPGISFNT